MKRNVVQIMKLINSTFGKHPVCHPKKCLAKFRGGNFNIKDASHPGIVKNVKTKNLELRVLLDENHIRLKKSFQNS